MDSPAKPTKRGVEGSKQGEGLSGCVVGQWSLEILCFGSASDSGHGSVMVRHLFSVLAMGPVLALTGASASAELLDVRLLPSDGGGARLWLMFESEPTGVEARLADGALVVRVEGAGSRAREIVSLHGPARRMVLRPLDDGAVEIRLPGLWVAYEARLAEGGVLIRLDGEGLGEAVIAASGAGSSVAPTSDMPPARLASAEELAAGMRLAREAAPEPQPPTPPERAAPERADIETAPARTAETPAGPAASECADTASAVEDSPWDLGAMAAYGDCLAEAGRAREAAGLYERVLAFEPEHFAASFGLAKLRAAQGDRAGASVLFETAQAAARTDGEALGVQAAARAALGQ